MSRYHYISLMFIPVSWLNFLMDGVKIWVSSCLLWSDSGGCCLAFLEEFIHLSAVSRSSLKQG